MSEGSWGPNDIKLRRTHEGYILVILLSVIVVLVSIKWYEIKDLAALLSFALTLSSLILAVVAIGYAIYSNASVESSVTTLVATSQEVKDTADLLATSSNTLRTEIKTLSDVTGEINSRIDTQNNRLEALSERLQANPSENTTLNRVPEYDAGAFIANSSVLGLFGLLMYAYSSEKHVKVNIEKILKKINGDLSYVLGYLVACSAARIIPEPVGTLVTDGTVEINFRYDDVRKQIVMRAEKSGLGGGPGQHGKFWMRDLLTTERELMENPSGEEKAAAPSPLEKVVEPA